MSVANNHDELMSPTSIELKKIKARKEQGVISQEQADVAINEALKVSAQVKIVEATLKAEEAAAAHAHGNQPIDEYDAALSPTSNEIKNIKARKEKGFITQEQADAAVNEALKVSSAVNIAGASSVANSFSMTPAGTFSHQHVGGTFSGQSQSRSVAGTFSGKPLADNDPVAVHLAKIKECQAQGLITAEQADDAVSATMRADLPLAYGPPPPPKDAVCGIARRTFSGACLIAWGLIAIAIGIIFLVAIPNAIVDTVMSKMYVKENEGLYDTFKTQDSTYSFYVYNLNNGPAVLTTGAKPDFTLVGPYRYKVKSEKLNINFLGPSMALVQYQLQDTFTFDPQTSIDAATGRQLSENDPVTQLNVISYTLSRGSAIGGTCTPTGWFGNQQLQKAFNQSIIHTKTVKQFVWGYVEPLLAHPAVNITPPAMPLYVANRPVTGQEYEEYTGVATAPNGLALQDSVSWITMFRGMRQLPYWASEAANRPQFHQWKARTKLQDSDIVEMWINTLYRVVQLGFTDNVDFRDLKLKRFRLKSNVLEPNPAYFMSTKGFAPVPPLLKVPYILSKPVFLDADITMAGVTINGKGITESQDRNKHDVWLDFEPLTGLPFSVRNRLQINTFTQPVVCNTTLVHPFTANLPVTYWPMIYVEQASDADNSDADSLYEKVYRPMYALYVVGIFIIIVGGIMFFIGIYFCASLQNSATTLNTDPTK